VVMSIFKLYCV